jgi:hypothetical protein
MYGPQTIYISPVPDQTYQIELDTVVEPTALVNATDVEPLPAPYTDVVPFYAAHLAKYKEQSYGEAELFKNEYTKKLLNVLSTSFTRRMPDPYSTVY